MKTTFKQPRTRRLKDVISDLCRDGRAEFASKRAALSIWEHLPPTWRRAAGLRLAFDHDGRSFAIIGYPRIEAMNCKDSLIAILAKE